VESDDDDEEPGEEPVEGATTVGDTTVVAKDDHDNFEENFEPPLFPNVGSEILFEDNRKLIDGNVYVDDDIYISGDKHVIVQVSGEEFNLDKFKEKIRVDGKTRWSVISKERAEQLLDRICEEYKFLNFTTSKWRNVYFVVSDV